MGPSLPRCSIRRISAAFEYALAPSVSAQYGSFLVGLRVEFIDDGANTKDKINDDIETLTNTDLNATWLKSRWPRQFEMASSKIFVINL